MREARMMKVRELARRADVDVSYVSRIEHGQFPPPSAQVVSRLARALGCKEDALIKAAGRIPDDIHERLRALPEARFEDLRAFLAHHTDKQIVPAVVELPSLADKLKLLGEMERGETYGAQKWEWMARDAQSTQREEDLRKAATHQQRAAVLREAARLMEKAGSLPKTADGVTVFPGDWVWTWFEETDGTITTSRSCALSQWSGIHMCYSTEQAARRRGQKARGGG
jgi:transcriptional regulator with XRE-family HTH domain